MAKVFKPPFWEGPVNSGETRLIEFLTKELPDNYFLIPNIELSTINPRNNTFQILEYDLLIIAPHAIYNIENKDFAGYLEGNDYCWHYGTREASTPHKTVNYKSKVLVSKLKEENPQWIYAFNHHIIHSIVTLSFPSQTKDNISGNCTLATFLLNEELINFITDTHGLKQDFIASFQTNIIKFLIGEAKGKTKKEVRGFEIIEIIEQEENYKEYICKSKVGQPKRVKEYVLDIVGLNEQEQEKHIKLIKNQYSALEKIGKDPYIVNVEFDIDEQNNFFYEIFDDLDLNTLKAELKYKNYTFEDKLNIIKNIINAIKSAHKEKIFHREISPENIFIVKNFAKLGNFGKAYLLEHSNDDYTVMPTLNKNNITPYHAIELLGRKVFPSSDIYSLGVLIYELFVGQLPIKDPFELRNLGGSLPEERLPTKINNSLPIWLDELCKRTIVQNHEKRWQSIDNLEEFLKINENFSPVTKPRPLQIEDPFKIGDTVGSYTIYEQIGKGGSSRVFRVKHTLMGDEYAMKVFKQVDAEGLINEYKILKEIVHPNIVKFVWCEKINTFFVAITELIKGENIKKIGELEINKVYELGEQICSALVYLHQKNIINRDIKPQNIIWDNQERFVLIDFNIASSTNSNGFVGTFSYMAPDLVESAEKVNWDFSADTFALGITLYELICKQHPWANGIPDFIPPKNPKELNNSISDEFVDFLLKAVQPKKNDRFDTAQKMLDALKFFKGRIEKSKEQQEIDRLEEERKQEKEWNITNNTNTKEAYKNYLNKYPKGLHADQADKLIKDIELKEKEIEILRKEKQEIDRLEKERKKEEADWKAIKSVNTKEAYKNYLNKYPKGLHADQADKLIKDIEFKEKEIEILKKEKQERDRLEKERKKEETDWKAIKSVHTKEAYKKYLNKYPKGLYFDEATKSIKEIEFEEKADLLKKEQQKPEVNEKKVNEKSEICWQHNSHSGAINTVTFSSDGKYALSGSEDKTLKIWDVSSGQEMKTFEGHASGVKSVCFSPDDKYALSGSEDKTFKLWDGLNISTFKGHSAGINSVSFSPDGRFILSGSSDKILKLWDVSTGHEIITFKGHSGRVNSASFSSDGRYVLSGSSDKTLKLWDASNGHEIITFKGYSGSINSAGFSPDGRFILFGSVDGMISLLDIGNLPQARISPANIEMILIHEGEFIIGSEDGTLDAKPQHKVYLDAYYIGKYPVTVGQFKTFVDDTGYKTEMEKKRNKYTWKKLKFIQGNNHPVVHITWNDAIAFSKWAGGRLPTEAEWEKAARGTDGRIYPWGNNEPDKSCCNFTKNVNQTTSVDKYPSGASPYGVMDMTGNICEWVNDWYYDNYYSISPENNPQGPDDGKNRVIRGGRAECSFRSNKRPSTCDDHLGFRLARSL